MSDAFAFMDQNYETIGKVLAAVFASAGVIITIYLSARSSESKNGEYRFTIESLFNTVAILVAVIWAAGLFVFIWPFIIAGAVIVLIIWWIKARRLKKEIRAHFEKCYPKGQYPVHTHHH